MLCRWRPLLSSFSTRLTRRTLATSAPEPAAAPTQVILRPYQELCLASCTQALASGSTRIGVSLPTGAGKTTVFISLLARIPPPATNKEATRALIVVNSIELARQSAAQVGRMFPEWVVELEQGAKNHATGLADVTIATYQTLNNEQRLRKFDTKMMKAIIIDEAHHAAAPSYRRLLSQFHADIKHPEGIEMANPPPHKIPIIGFSATFSRHDGIALGSVFERIVYHRDFLEMIKEQWLCDVRFTSVKAKLDLSKVALNPLTKDFNTASLASVVNSPEMNHLVVRSWLDRASERKSTLVFCVNIAHVKELTQTYRGYGVDARYITAATAKTDRQELVEAFRNGEFPVLINCAILTEGADIPNIDCVVLARPTRSRNLFAQMVGRGMRLSPGTGKTDCRIIDFVDAHSRVGGGVISVPMLFGLDPGEFDINDETIETLEQRMAEQEAKREAAAREAEQMAAELKEAGGVEPLQTLSNANYSVSNPFTVTYIDHDDAFGFVEDVVQDNAGRPVSSRFAWVNCGDGVWVLTLHTYGFIRVEPVEVGDGLATFVHPEAVPEDERSDSEDERASADAGSNSNASAPPPGPLFKAHFTPGNPDPTSSIKFWASRLILKNMPLDDAIRACDYFFVNKVYPESDGPPSSMFTVNAKWRKAPASDAQRDMIKKIQKTNKALAKVSVETLTKGQAATIITRLKHGAMGRFKNKKKAEDRANSIAKRKADALMAEMEAKRRHSFADSSYLHKN